MHDFVYTNGELHCEKVSLSQIAREVGTPCYVYSFKTLADHLAKLQKALRPLKPLICFSMKSNSNLAVCKLLVDRGAGLDIVSGGELYRALKIGASPKRIVFAGVGKSDEEIKEAIRHRILMFNVESAAELERINEFAGELRGYPNVALRVNPGIEAETHDYVKTGIYASKFGLPPKAARDLVRRKDQFRHVHLAGVHIHIGSQITETAPFVRAIRKTIEWIESLRREGHEIQWLNIGGGLGIIYREENPQTPRQFARAIVPLLRGKGFKVILEPGRFITGNAGALVTRVRYIKETPAKRFVIVDAGMNDLIRPSLYGAYHQILPVHGENGKWKMESGEWKVDIVGPICESGDFLAKDRRLPRLERGGLLAVMSAGAYGFTMASNYNSRPRPAEILVRGKQFAVVRERESYADLVRGEKIPALI